MSLLMLPFLLFWLTECNLQGIAVGMATNIPPHNMGEVVSALEALIKNPSITTGELMQYIPGPDFPTGLISNFPPLLPHHLSGF